MPLIVRFPPGRGPGANRLEAMADLLDVAPTIADVMGVLGQGGSDRQFQGRSLLPVLFGAGGETSVRSRTVWDRPIYAQRDPGHKFVFDTRTGQGLLFDLGSDPGEQHDLARSEPLRAAWSRQTLQHWIASVARGGAAGAPEPTRLSREQCESLKALGYLGADVRCPAK